MDREPRTIRILPECVAFSLKTISLWKYDFVWRLSGGDLMDTSSKVLYKILINVFKMKPGMPLMLKCTQRCFFFQFKELS